MTYGFRAPVRVNPFRSNLERDLEGPEFESQTRHLNDSQLYPRPVAHRDALIEWGSTHRFKAQLSKGQADHRKLMAQLPCCPLGVSFNNDPGLAIGLGAVCGR